MPRIPMTLEQIEVLAQAALNRFCDRRIAKLDGLKLDDVLKTKNPYLFRAIGIETPAEMVESLLQAYMSSSEETIFGDAFFEPIVLGVTGGQPSSGEGLDVDDETDEEFIVVAVKSGPKWGNAQARARLKDNFDKARHIYGTRRSKKEFVALLGQAYGTQVTQPTAKKPYLTLSGQAFWEYISGDADFYLKLTSALGASPVVQRARYRVAFEDAVTRFTAQFRTQFCDAEGQIDWEALTRFNSGIREKRPKVARARSRKKP